MTDSDLDAIISAVLRTDTVVTTRKKQRAWAQLVERAAHQTMWPAFDEPEKTLFTRVLKFGWKCLRRSVAILLTDESGYERARRERTEWCYGLSASGGHSQMLLEFSPQLRTNI